MSGNSESVGVCGAGRMDCGSGCSGPWVLSCKGRGRYEMTNELTKQDGGTVDRLMARMEAKYTTEPNSGCWLWFGSQGTRGHGQIWESGRVRPAHAVMYERSVGPIPEGLEIDHLCRTPCCVNPKHLEPVTHMENVRRGTAGRISGARNAAKTHCSNGHVFDEANTYKFTFMYKDRPSIQRHCRACHAAVQRNRKEK